MLDQAHLSADSVAHHKVTATVANLIRCEEDESCWWARVGVHVNTELLNNIVLFFFPISDAVYLLVYLSCIDLYCSYFPVNQVRIMMCTVLY